MWCVLIFAVVPLPVALDDVRVGRSLHDVVDLADLVGLGLEDANERFADDAALLLRVGHALKLRQEALGRIDVDEFDLHMAAERVDDALRLLAAHKAVVDEDAGELVADGLV